MQKQGDSLIDFQKSLKEHFLDNEVLAKKVLKDIEQ